MWRTRDGAPGRCRHRGCLEAVGFVEGLGHRDEMLAGDVAFHQHLRGELTAVRRRFDHDVLEPAGGQPVERALIATSVGAPETHRATDRVVPDRPVRRTPPPRHRQLREAKQLGQCLQARGTRHPRHRVRGLRDDERELDPLELRIRLEQAAEDIPANHRDVGPLDRAIEPVGNVVEPADHRRALHRGIVAQTP